jgi:hypothetical protein
MRNATTNQKGESKMMTFQKIANEVKKFQTEKVTICIGQGTILFRIWEDRKADRQEMAEIKAAAVTYVMENDDRKWFHAKSGKHRVWRWHGEHTRNLGLICGIRIKLTDEERKAIMMGPDAWKALQE